MQYKKIQIGDSQLSNWDPLDSIPCNWDGITCTNDLVVQIDITDSLLKGFLVPQLAELTSLLQVILHGNRLFGTIPKELGLLKQLSVLDLGSNEFTGTISAELGNLANLVTLNLQANELSGKLPVELGNLGNLEELYLDRNKLQGTLPADQGNGISPTGLCRTSGLKVADFSSNFFMGSIPSCLTHLPRDNFKENCLQEINPTQRAANMCGGRNSSDTSSSSQNPEQT